MGDVLNKISISVFNAIPYGMILFDAGMNLVFINRKLQEIFHVNMKDVEHENWKAWLTGKLVGRSPEVMERWIRLKIKKSQRATSFLAHLESYPRLIVTINHIETEQGNLHLVIFQESGDIEKKLVRSIQDEIRSDINVARKIQQHINNSLIPMVEGRFFKYHFQSVFLPSSILSGDLINMQQATRRYTSLFLGDGKGHGLPAALYSSLIYSYTNMMAARVAAGVSDTSQLVKEINEVAMRDFSGTGEYFFFSGIYVLIDGNSDQIRITGAGHPPVYRIRDGMITMTSSHGPLVGVVKDPDYSYVDMTIKDGDVFLFYTDGIYDVRFPGFRSGGPDELLEFLQQYMQSNPKPEDILPYLSDAITHADRWGNIADDISVIAMRVEEKTNM